MPESNDPKSNDQAPPAPQRDDELTDAQLDAVVGASVGVSPVGPGAPPSTSAPPLFGPPPRTPGFRAS